MLPISEIPEQCAHCKRYFKEGEIVWIHSELGAICKPDPGKECDATHCDPFRVPESEWQKIPFGEVFEHD